MKFQIKLLVILILVGIFLISGCTEKQKEISNCIKSDGQWKGFSNTCVGSCDYVRGYIQVCGQILTQGCDCGPNMCWNGLTCEENGEKKYDYVPDKITVRFKQNLSEEKIFQIIEYYNGSIIRKHKTPSGLMIYEINIPDDKTVPQMVDMYNNNPNVDLAEPDRIVKLLTTN